MSATSIRLQPGDVSSPPEFDLFVVHAEADRAWVEGYLRPMLGLEPARVFTPRDFRLGARTDVEFERGVTSSRFTLLVLSPAFLADRWAEFGEGLVSFSSVDEGRNRLLVLTLHPCQAPCGSASASRSTAPTGTAGTTRPPVSGATSTHPSRRSRPPPAPTPGWSPSARRTPASSTAATPRSKSYRPRSVTITFSS